MPGSRLAEPVGDMRLIATVHWQEFPVGWWCVKWFIFGACAARVWSSQDEYQTIGWRQLSGSPWVVARRGEGGMNSEPRREDKKERRRRARETLLLLFQRVREVCGAVARGEDFADQVEDLAKQIVDFANSTEIRDLVPETRRRQLSSAAEAFQAAKDELDKVHERCRRLQEVMDAVEKALTTAGPPMPVVAAAAVAVIVVGVGIAVAVAANRHDGNTDAEPTLALPTQSDGPTATAEGTDPQDVESVSHEIGEPSSQRVVVVHWSPHEGWLAFSIDWTTGPRDEPDTVADLSGDAGEAISPSLPDGEWYFHLRTQGSNGEWTSTVHLGPFVIEASAQCPAFDNLALKAQPPELGSGDVRVVWQASGGCAPFTGRLTATVSADQLPYATYPITEPSGEQLDQVDVADLPCEGEPPLDIVYQLTLTDARRQQLEATTGVAIAPRIC